MINRWSNDGRVSSDEEHLAWLQANAGAWIVGAPVVDLAIVDVASGDHVGIVGIQRGLPYLLPGEVNLTYNVYRGRRGHGYATAAVVEAMRLALSQVPAVRFIIRCDPANKASSSVARRLAFRYMGSITEPGGWVGDRYAWDVAHGSLPRCQ